jgi:hypothetical protein
MSSPFQKSFCGKSPLKPAPLNQLDFGKVKKDPSVMDERSETNQYFDSITKLPGMKENYAAHVERKTKGYTTDEGVVVPADPSKIVTPQRHAVGVEIGKGGKSGVEGLNAISTTEYKDDYKSFVKKK